MGSFGPFAFPLGLKRAQQHAWHWKEAGAVVTRHRGVVRLKLSYVFGAKDEMELLPPKWSPIDELLFLSRVAIALAADGDVLAHFNPNGETIWSPVEFAGTYQAATAQDKLPLLLWTNVRFFKLDARWSLMDTVGNSQFDLPDVEAVFDTQKYSATDVGYYLRNVTHYLLDVGRPLKTGETIDGPNENNLSWEIENLEKGLALPPRPVMRLSASADQKAISKALATAKQPSK